MTAECVLAQLVVGTMEDPMSLNRYVYARDNPEKYVDPEGHKIIDESSDRGFEILSSVSMNHVLLLDAKAKGVNFPTMEMFGTWTTYVNWNTGQYYVVFKGWIATQGLLGGGVSSVSIGAPIQSLSIQPSAYTVGFNWMIGGKGDTEVFINTFGMGSSAITLQSQIQQMHGSDPYLNVDAHIFENHGGGNYAADGYNGQIQAQGFACYPD